MKIPESYTDILKDRGVPLSEINPGSKEIALFRKDSLLALDIIRESGLIILGGDVLERINGKLQYTYDNWSYQRRAGETPEQQATASIEEAHKYISSYNSHAESEPMFVFVLSG